MAWEPMTLSAARKAEGSGYCVPAAQLMHGKDVHLREGGVYFFSTEHHRGEGVVLSIDHSLHFPVEMQVDFDGVRRIERYSPDHFTALWEVR